MDQLWSDIISTSFGGAAAGLTLYLVQNWHGGYRDSRDSKRVYKWMVKQSGPEHGWDYRSTRTIASYNNLTEDRVRYICSYHDKIFLSTGKAEDLWTLNDRLARIGESLPE